MHIIFFLIYNYYQLCNFRNEQLIQRCNDLPLICQQSAPPFKAILK